MTEWSVDWLLLAICGGALLILLLVAIIGEMREHRDYRRARRFYDWQRDGE